MIKSKQHFRRLCLKHFDTLILFFVKSVQNFDENPKLKKKQHLICLLDDHVQKLNF